MNELQEFNFQGNQLRTVLIDSEPFFVGKDAATAIGYSNTRKAIRDHVKAKYQREERIVTPFGTQTMTVISEPGLYQLAGESKLPSAGPFQDWVYEQVLPSIRKHGAYMTPETIEKAIYNPEFIINLATQLKDEQAKTAALTADNETMKPKALFADAVATSHTSILIGDLAKLIRQNGVDIGQNRLFAWLRKHGYLIGSGDRRNMPTQRAMDLELFDIKERTFQNPDGSVRITKTTKVTGKGQQYFINKFLQKGIAV
ncbi:phage antirepressor [Lacticaseibacillus rhamnosus]|uniref:phage antirepressor KilAC domain-containing protein n=1 Tax=Lacticaseibacillus rhamnosus TaxID=47715 RepID=UPI0007E1B5BB|nr:phage antirepressor [Lacticaseibacillus rhamnosus]OAU76085.1 antirepressor [Lacticaseibacillus rhamnosus]